MRTHKLLFGSVDNMQGGGAYAYIAPTAYVGIEVNPSIELGINCFDYLASAAASLLTVSSTSSADKLA